MTGVRAAVLVALLAGTSFAHPLAPVLLDLRERADGTTVVLWKTPLARPAGADLHPSLPAECAVEGNADVDETADARLARGTVRCSRGWVGRTLRVEGLAAGGTNALVRLSLADGRLFRALLSAERPAVVVPAAPSRLDVARDYVRLGVEHLVTGLDHVLFVIGLVLLVRGGRRLLVAVTAFTVGHSLTLGAAVLGFVHLPQGPVEVLIALSLVVVAAAIGESGTPFAARHPGRFAATFGLLHGLGFAGTLASTGIPAGEIPLALAAFNAGIEAGQLAVVAACLAIARLARALPVPEPAPVLAAYGIGIVAARWVFERAAGVVFG